MERQLTIQTPNNSFGVSVRQFGVLVRCGCSVLRSGCQFGVDVSSFGVDVRRSFEQLLRTTPMSSSFGQFCMFNCVHKSGRLLEQCQVRRGWRITGANLCCVQIWDPYVGCESRLHLGVILEQLVMSFSSGLVSATAICSRLRYSSSSELQQL